MSSSAHIPALGVLVLIGVAVGGYRCATTQPLPGLVPPAVAPAFRPDPNTAAAEELEVVPGIGRTRARALVAYREQQRSATGQDMIFRTADDLRKVRGFGAVTAARAAEHLTFPPLPPEP